MGGDVSERAQWAIKRGKRSGSVRRLASKLACDDRDVKRNRQGKLLRKKFPQEKNQYKLTISPLNKFIAVKYLKILGEAFIEGVCFFTEMLVNKLAEVNNR